MSVRTSARFRLALRALLGLGLLLALGLLALFAALFLVEPPDTAHVPSALAEQALLPPPEGRTPGVRLSMLRTGYAEGPEALMMHGGSLFETVRAEHAAFLVEHPQLTFLFDTGLGEDVDRQFAEMPLWARPLFAYRKTSSAAEQLRRAGRAPGEIRAIVVSHLHWDHASGLEDFPQAEVRVTREELAFARSPEARPPAYVPSQYDQVRFRELTFGDGPYGPFARSERLFAGDDSVIFVPLEGHTPGSVGMLVRLESGRRLLFVGDLVWRAQAVTLPAPRSRPASAIVDADGARAFRAVEAMRRVALNHPSLQLVPAHDPEGQGSLALFPRFTR